MTDKLQFDAFVEVEVETEIYIRLDKKSRGASRWKEKNGKEMMAWKLTYEIKLPQLKEPS